MAIALMPSYTPNIPERFLDSHRGLPEVLPLFPVNRVTILSSNGLARTRLLRPALTASKGCAVEEARQFRFTEGFCLVSEDQRSLKGKLMRFSALASAQKSLLECAETVARPP